MVKAVADCHPILPKKQLILTFRVVATLPLSLHPYTLVA